MAEKPHAMILEAADETGLPIKTFPNAAPVTLARVLDIDDPPNRGGKGKASALP
jgi:hypothetical protein